MHGDDEPYGSAQHVELFDQWPRRPQLTDVVGIMNRAATEDGRSPVWPVISRVLHTGPAPSARDQQVVELLDDWVARDAPRLDADGDGLYDDPGPAILDAAWGPIAEAVMRPVFGDLLDELSDVRGLGGQSGHSYVDKDLRTLLGSRVRGKFNLRYCGGGSLEACRASLWQAVHEAADELAAELGQPDPAGVAGARGTHRLHPGPDPQHVPDHQPTDLPAGPGAAATVTTALPFSAMAETILERVQSDTRTAMKAGERDRVAALRLVADALQKDRKQGGEDEVAVLRRERKRRLEAADAYREGGSSERAEAEEAEAREIERYLPAEISDADLVALVDEAVAESGAASPGEMGKVMGAVMPKVAGRADGKRVSAAVRERLG